jgi:hypothetical protein
MSTKIFEAIDQYWQDDIGLLDQATNQRELMDRANELRQLRGAIPSSGIQGGSGGGLTSAQTRDAVRDGINLSEAAFAIGTATAAATGYVIGDRVLVFLGPTGAIGGINLTGGTVLASAPSISNFNFATATSTTPLTAIANSTKTIEIPEPGDVAVAGSATIPMRAAAGALSLSPTSAERNGIPTTATAVSLTVWPDQETRNNLNNVNQGYLAALQLVYTIDGTSPGWGTADLGPNCAPLKYGDRLILSRADALRLRMLANSDTLAATPVSPGRPQVTFYGLEGTAPPYPIYQAYDWSILPLAQSATANTVSSWLASTELSLSTDAVAALPAIPAAAKQAVLQFQYSDENTGRVARARIDGQNPTQTTGWFEYNDQTITLSTRAEVLAYRIRRLDGLGTLTVRIAYYA